MFNKTSNNGYQPVLEKIRQKTLVFGANTLLTEFRLDQGALLPRHQHPHEQAGYLFAGHLELTIGDAAYLAEPGDNWCIPSGAPITPAPSPTASPLRSSTRCARTTCLWQFGGYLT